MNESQSYCVPIETSWVAAPIGTIAAVGSVINIWNFYRFSVCRGARCASFKLLWMSRCLANASILLLFLVYAVPTITCNRQVPDDTIGPLLANWCGTPYLTIVLAQILLAVHRFTASISVTWYHRVSNITSTKIQLGVVWIIGIASTVLWLVEDCYFYFDLEFYSWEEKCAQWIIDISTSIPVKVSIAMVILLNSVTFIQLFRISRRKKSSIKKLQWRRNVRLLVQGVLQDCFFIADIIVQDYITPLRVDDDKMWYIWCYSISWQLSHLFDGTVMLIFTPELHEPIYDLFGKKSVSLFGMHTQMHNIRNRRVVPKLFVSTASRIHRRAGTS